MRGLHFLYPTYSLTVLAFGCQIRQRWFGKKQKTLFSTEKMCTYQKA